jgi:hypothetical protein
MRCSTACCLCVILLATVGCGGDAQKRYRVSGTVTYKGLLLKAGSIDFQPEVSGQGQPAGTEIKDGRFEFSSANGLLPGKYKVAISAVGGPAPNPSGDGPAPPRIKELPDVYNSRTKLRVEVTPGGPNEFPFDLQ